MATIVNFDVSRVLLNRGSSCDIIYSDFFDKIGLKKEKYGPVLGWVQPTGLQRYYNASLGIRQDNRHLMRRKGYQDY